MPAETPHNEKELLLQVVQGDADAFAGIYELYKDKIFAFAFTLTKSKDIAAEAVQEVFFRLWEKRGQIDADQPFTAYIKKITYHHIIDFFRKAKRDRALQQQLYAKIEALRNSTEDELMGKELHRLYRQAIDQLPPQKKKIYLLSREQQLSYEAIAAETGISKNTVRNHMTEAIRFIRRYVTTHSDTAFLVLAICLHRHQA